MAELIPFTDVLHSRAETSVAFAKLLFAATETSSRALLAKACPRREVPRVGQRRQSGSWQRALPLDC